MSATSESYYMHGLTFCRMVKTQFLSKVMSLVYLITNVNETRETRLEKLLGIENFISHGQEFQVAGPHATFTIV